ncbi:hypothetical protein RB195_008843 [Necator americanus]|uniref:Myb-like DNA-binding domain protein n=1 Tax=Necator americanus TaxID=51031 RepID=A0ABR1CRS0_NECAM
MFPTAGGSSQAIAQESAAPQSQQGLDFFRAFAQIAAQTSHSQQPASQYIASLGQQSVHAAQLAAQQHSPSISLLQQGITRQVDQHQDSATEQSNQPVRDDPHRRPSLMSNFFPPHISHQQGTSRDENHLDVDASGSFAGMKIDPSPGSTTLSDKETEEAEKKATSDRLEAIEKDRKQADQQVETLTKRRERLKNIKKESEQEVKDVPNGETDERENIPLWQRIIAENKKRSLGKSRLAQKRPAQEALFFEPYDAPGMSDLLKKQKTFGPKLRQMVEFRHRVKVACYKYNDEFYSSCMRDFLRKTERWEHSPKKIARDLRNREIFERAFPEMKRTREEKERSCRNDRISLRGQDPSDDAAGSGEKAQVDEEFKMRNAAAIPPLLIHESNIRPRLFDNKHAVIKDAAQANKNWIETFLASWSDEEKNLFRERLAAVGKNYANIAMFLENKTVKDCVLYYYLCKKRENFKSLIPKRKRKLAKTYKPPIMPTPEELAMYQLVPQDAVTEAQSSTSQDSKCVMCQLRIDPTTNPGRILTRSNYEMYGIDAKKQGADCKICTKCKDEVLKIRNSGRCMVKVCASGKRKVKATKAMPAKWRQMDDRQRAFMLAHMSIPREIVKCCGPCFKRISKKLDLLFAGELDEEMAKFELEIHQTWQTAEISRLQNLVAQLGQNWCSISEQMNGRSADDCRMQYESLTKKEEEDEEDFEEDDKERHEDEMPMEEDTQDVPDVSVVTLPDGDGDLDITEVPTTSTAAALRASPAEVKPKEESLSVIEQPTTASGLVKGSITAGTPFRPPSVSIIEQQQTGSQLAAAAAAAVAASASSTPQPTTTQAMLAGFDQNTLMQLHQLFAGADENRARAILEQYQQQQQRNFQQFHQFVQQPSVEQLYMTYSQFSEADLNRIHPTVDVATRCVIELILQHRKQQTANLQMRQQHAAMLSQIQAKQLEQQRQERLQQEKQRQIDAAKKQLQEQIKHHDITAANIDKNTIAMAHRVGEINHSLQTASLTQQQRQQLLLEYSSQSAKCSSLQTMAQNHRLQRTQLQNQLDALNAGSGSAAAVASMSLSASPMVLRTHDASMPMDDEQRLREEIEKIDEDIRGMEKQVRRLEEEERTYQKKKMQAEQMITSAFRINSTVQDYQAKQELKEAQDNMRVVEHSRLTFQKKLDNLRENRELLMRQQRMLLNSGNTSGVIVGGSGSVSKGAVKDFTHSQQQAAKAVQPSTPLSLAAQAQAQQLHQLQLQQHKNLIGIRQPTADSKPPTSAHSPWPGASANKDRDGSHWGENKRFNNMLDRVVHEELTNSHAAQQAAHAAAAAHSSVAPPEIRRKSGLEMLNIPSVSVARHPHQRRPISPLGGAVGIQRPSINPAARSILGGASAYGALAINTSHGATGSPQMSGQHMSPSVSAAPSSVASNVFAHFQQSLSACSPASQASKTPQPMTSPALCVSKADVPAAVVQPMVSPALPNTTSVLTSVPSFQDTNVPSSTAVPPPPTLQFLASSTVSGPPTYEPISPDDSAPTSPVVRPEVPPSVPTSSSGSRMFSALDFDFPLAVTPSSTAPPPPSLAPPLAELLRTATSDAAIASAMTFEPLSDDDD